MTFQFVANFGGTDEDDIKEYIRAGILGSLNGLFIFGQIIDSTIRAALKMRIFKPSIPILTILDNVTKAISKLRVDDITDKEVMEAIERFLRAGQSFGLPTVQAINMSRGIKDLHEGNIKQGVGGLLGWSQYHLRGPEISTLARQYVEARDKGNKKLMAEIEKEINVLNVEKEKFNKEKHAERLKSMSTTEQKKFLEDKKIDIKERADNIIQDKLRKQYGIDGKITDEFNIKKMAAMPVEDFKKLKETYAPRTQSKMQAGVSAWRRVIKPEAPQKSKKDRVREFFIR